MDNDFDKFTLFASLRPEERAAVEACFEARDYNAGRIIFREGDEANAFYIVAKGRVEILRGDLSTQPVVVAGLGPGEFFGEMGLLEDAPRMAAARMSETGTLLVVKTSVFASLLDEHPRLGMQIRAAVMKRHTQNVSTILEQ